MTRTQAIKWLTAHNACTGEGSGMEWVENRKRVSPRQLWETCPRGDWLLWAAARAGVDRRVVVLAACACARLALPFVRPGEDRPRRAIELAELWARGEAGITIADLRAAAAAAYAADAAAYATAAAAYAADAAAYAAAYAAYAAAYAAYAAAAADAADALQQKRAEVLSQCADLVREHITWEMVERAIGGQS